MIDTYRSRQDLLQAQQRELAALEQQIFEAAERESQQIIATARQRVRTILLDARRELLVLTAQVAASREHSRGPAPEFPNVVRAVIGSARPEIESLEAEASALRATFRQFPPVGESPLPSPEPPLPRESAQPPEPPAPAPIVVDVRMDHDIEAEAADLDEHPGLLEPIGLSMPALTPASGSRVLITAMCIAVVAAAGIVFWWQRPGEKSAPAPTATTQAKATASRNSGAAPAAAAAAATPVRTNGPTSRSIVIETRRPVWLRVNVDDKTDPGHLVPAGERREITADRVSIRAGDAGAVVVSVNGATTEALGRDGIALTRDFSLKASPKTAAPPAAAAPIASTSATPVNTAIPRPQTTAAVPAVATPPPAVASAAAKPIAAPAKPAAAQAAETGSGTTPAPGVPAEVEIMRAAETWFSAFFRRDQSGMTQAGGRTTVIDDQRGASDVPSPALNVRRTFEQGNVQVVGNSAMYTGRLVETVPGGDRFVSLVSQVWLRNGTSWQLLNVRLSSESHVREALR